MEVNVLELDNIWGELDLGQGGYQYVMDQNGNVIYTPGDEEAQTVMSSSTVDRLMHMEAGSLEQNTDGTKRLFISELSAYSGWRFVASVPLSELQRPIATIRSATLWVGAGTLLAACGGLPDRSISSRTHSCADERNETDGEGNLEQGGDEGKAR